MKQLIDYWTAFLKNKQSENWWQRKRQTFERRSAQIVSLKTRGHIYHRWRYDQYESVHYLMHFTILVKQGNYFYLEESIQPFETRFNHGTCVSHDKLKVNQTIRVQNGRNGRGIERNKSLQYDRRVAVQYAEYWWNQYNPKFPQFTVDCTNFISQCLRAGGASMQGAPDRESGWWYRADNWSYSWSVAHSLRWYLSGATRGLQGKEVDDASQLKAGDVICYDFEGDGRWDHNTIVVAKDEVGEPLVNAHTDNSRHRFWSYEDSTAWTPKIKYKFFRIYVTS